MRVDNREGIGNGTASKLVDPSANGKILEIEQTFETGIRLGSFHFFLAFSLRFTHKVFLNMCLGQNR
jgi:hypothetical protein